MADDDGFDVIVIGTGPGGYVAAVRAAQLDLKTAVVEKDAVGGRCLNYACIPAKAVLHSAGVYDETQQHAADVGIQIEGASIDWEKVGERRSKVIETLTGGVTSLFKKHDITVLNGIAKLAGDGKIEVDGEDEGTYTAEKGILLATGSVALPVPGTEFGGRVLDTWGAWSLEELPSSIAIIGSGASGSEVASAYGRMGVEVHLIEMLDQILPAEDADCAKVVQRAFKKQNINVLTGTKVEDVEPGEDSVKLTVGDDQIEVDYLCIAAGRKPDVEALGLDDAGVETDDETGKVTIDEYQQTSADGIWAIGDLVRGPALAHKSSEEGVIAVERMAGHDTHPLDPDLVPGATFCQPQVASVGMTEAEAKESGRDIKVGKFQLGGVGAGTIYDDRRGIVKIIGDTEYGEIIGAHIVGNTACDMISEIVNVIALEGGYPELARIIHPHPTISEAVLDGARAVTDWAIHA
ncbi:MAG: dihydrolipoyl dehydrogenase [Solirubrobacterales bacterium]